MKKLCVLFTFMFCLMTVNIAAFAHPGKLDKNGGHNKKADGTYHYHVEGDRTIEFSSPPTQEDIDRVNKTKSSVAAAKSSSKPSESSTPSERATDSDNEDQGQPPEKTNQQQSNTPAPDEQESDSKIPEPSNANPLIDSPVGMVIGIALLSCTGIGMFLFTKRKKK